jgi:Spy/CpxP family protein refolding chaperone
MASGYFIFGFAAALALVLAIFLGTYYYLKRTRWKTSNIKGYLDLIPDLTAEQRQKVQEIRETFLPKVERIRQGLCQKRAVLAEVLFSQESDKSKVHSVVQEILRYQSELEHEVVEHILEEKEILNPKQQRRFYDIILEQFAHGGLGVHDIKGRRKP